MKHIFSFVLQSSDPQKGVDLGSLSILKKVCKQWKTNAKECSGTLFRRCSAATLFQKRFQRNLEKQREIIEQEKNCLTLQELQELPPKPKKNGIIALLASCKEKEPLNFLLQQLWIREALGDEFFKSHDFRLDFDKIQVGTELYINCLLDEIAEVMRKKINSEFFITIMKYFLGIERVKTFFGSCCTNRFLKKLNSLKM